jgi:hypothetical protein
MARGPWSLNKETRAVILETSRVAVAVVAASGTCHHFTTIRRRISRAGRISSHSIGCNNGCK